MKRWTITSVTEANGVITVTGTSYNKKMPAPAPFVVVLRKDQQGQDEFRQVADGVVTSHDGIERTSLAKHLLDTLAVTKRLKANATLTL